MHASRTFSLPVFMPSCSISSTSYFVCTSSGQQRAVLARSTARCLSDSQRTENWQSEAEHAHDSIEMHHTT